MLFMNAKSKANQMSTKEQRSLEFDKWLSGEYGSPGYEKDLIISPMVKKSFIAGTVNGAEGMLLEVESVLRSQRAFRHLNTESYDELTLCIEEIQKLKATK